MESKSTKSANKAKGRLGEEACAAEYEKRGYLIEARNWRKGNRGEIDIVAVKPGEQLICFCEVKTRSGSSFARASEAVGYEKRMRYRRLAEMFFWERPEFSNYYVRFDVAEVYLGSDGRPREIEMIEAAF